MILPLFWIQDCTAFFFQNNLKPMKKQIDFLCFFACACQFSKKKHRASRGNLGVFQFYFVNDFLYLALHMHQWNHQLNPTTHILKFYPQATLYLHSGNQGHPRWNKCVVSTHWKVHAGCTAHTGLLVFIKNLSWLFFSSCVSTVFIVFIANKCILFGQRYGNYNLENTTF